MSKRLDQLIGSWTFEVEQWATLYNPPQWIVVEEFNTWSSAKQYVELDSRPIVLRVICRVVTE